MFSLSGSSNVTDFFGAAFGAAAARVRGALFGGSSTTMDSFSGASIFFARPRVARVDSGAGASTATFFGRPLIALAGAGASSSLSSSGWTIFLGLHRVVFSSGSIMGSGSGCSSSSGASSDRVLRLVVDALRATFAFEAAVAILVVLIPVSFVLAAARARVTRFGGDWSFMMIELISIVVDAMADLH
jgi:hypothetical protein